MGNSLSESSIADWTCACWGVANWAFLIVSALFRASFWLAFSPFFAAASFSWSVRTRRWLDRDAHSPLLPLFLVIMGGCGVIPDYWCFRSGHDVKKKKVMCAKTFARNSQITVTSLGTIQIFRKIKNH